MNNYLIHIFCLLLTLMGCGEKVQHNHGTSSEASTAPRKEATSHGPDIILTSSQLERIGATFDLPQQRNLRYRIKIAGYAELPAENEAHISSYLDGKITTIAVKPGQAVQQGQILFKLTNPIILDWQSSLDDALVQLEFYQKEKERLQQLVNLDPGQKKALDEAQMHWSRLNVQRNALLKKLALLNIKAGGKPEDYITSIPILAPFSGFVKTIEANIGEFVNPSQRLMTMINLNHLHWEGKLSDRYTNLIKPGQYIDLQLLQNQNKLYSVKIYSIGQSVDAENHTFMVHAELPIIPEIKPGMYLEGWINSQADSALSIPVAALIRDRGLEYVMFEEHVEEDHHYFRKVPVKTGVQDGLHIEIEWLEPVTVQPKIVVEGAFFINAEAKKMEGGAESEHSH